MNPLTMRSNRYLVTSFLAACFLFSCTKTTETYQTAHLSEYFPVQVGKYITYRLDSTVFTSFGTVTEVHSFQEKQVVDAQFTDGSGRASYRVLRYTRDTAGTRPWAPAGSYSITPGDSTIEVNENNLRFIKLILPVKEGVTWKGNRYLPDDPFSPQFGFNSNFGISDWDYTYGSVDSSVIVKGQTYNGVLTVYGIDDSFNADRNSTAVLNTSSIAYVNYMKDVYAKGLGLIDQQFILWEYQPPNTSTSSGYQVGFAVRRQIIDHN